MQKDTETSANLKLKTMSKVYSEQVQKAQMLAAGLRKNFDLVKNRGISSEQIAQMEEDAKAVGAVTLDGSSIDQDINGYARVTLKNNSYVGGSITSFENYKTTYTYNARTEQETYSRREKVSLFKFYSRDFDIFKMRN